MRWTSALRDAFAAAVAELRDDPSVSAVVLTGAGGHFCAGGDIKTMAQAQGKRDIFEGRERIRKIHRWFDELVDLEKPVIAAVDGVAFGAGLSLALSPPTSSSRRRARRFCSVFTRLGYVPDMGAMYLLPRAIGLARAKDMVFSARVVDAQEALAIGLVQQVCEGDVLAGRARPRRALPLRAHRSLGIVKDVMNHAFESERRTVYAQEAMAQAMCRESEFHQEAARRFLAKEAPLYQWP